MKPSLQSLLFLLACAAFGPPRIALAQTCNQTSPLIYREANSTNTTDVEKRAATEIVNGTSFTYGGYTSTANGTTTNDIFQLTTDQQAVNLDARMLVWRQSNTGTPGTNNNEVDLTSPYAAQVTLTFTREVSNLSFVIQDIDKSTNGDGGSNFTDELAVYALNGAGTRVDLTNANIGYGVAGTATSSTINTFIDNITINGVTQDAVRGVTLNGGVGNNPSRTGNVTFNFPSPVKTVRLTLRNLNSRSDILGANNLPLRLQTIGIEQITWCAQADVATTLTGPTTAAVGSTVTYVATIANNGADQVTSVQPTVQLPTNLNGVTGGSYAPASGLLTLTTISGLNANTSVTRNITFTMPNAAVTGVVSVPTTGNGSTSAGSSAPDPVLTNNNGSLANASVTTTPSYSISGTVFEDINYGGGAGRSIATANAVTANSAVGVAAAATVELYNATTGAFVASTTTSTVAGSLGQYSFSNLPGGTSYTTRVVNSTVRSTRTGSTAALLGVQTFNGTTNRVGGEFPNLTDAGANTTNANLSTLTPANGTTAAQSLATVALGTANVPNINFGYNFDVVVNTNNAGQGSLRQFITNANALGGEGSLAQAGSYTNQQDLAANSQAAGRAPVGLPAGVETSIFMIPAAALTNGVAVITPATVLPQLTGANTAINGATQTFNIGNTNDRLLGVGGITGTNNTALSQVNGPEVQLTGGAAIAYGLDITNTATAATVRGLAISGFGNVIDRDEAANIRSAANGLVVNQTILGSTATAFALPGTVTNADNLRLTGGTSGIVVSNNLIGFANGKGIAVGNAVSNALLTNNEIRTNGLGSSGLDGIDIQGNTITVSNNLLTGTSGQGVDSYFSSGGNTIVGNTITDNGRGTATIAPNETPGVRIYGTNNNVSQNIISDNYGAGIMVQATGNGGAVAGTTVMSANSIFNNGNVTTRNGGVASGQVGIDLQANNTNEAAGTSPFVTLNSATTTGANGLLNYPILRTAFVSGTNLVITGYAKQGAVIELFTSQPNPAGVNATGANFGQGRTFLTTLTEGVNDNDATTGQSYSGNINGFNQGSDTNANGFSFTIPLSSLPGGALAAGTVLTSTATLNRNTSEFSGNVTTVSALTGFVYEDVNYGGGAGRSRATLGAAAIGSPGAKVELYNNAGALVGTAITDANGQYSFNAPVGTGYTVRVVNNSVISSRAGASVSSGSATTGYVSNQLAVQTYSGTISRVGGENPLLVDAAANTGSQTLAALTSGANLPQSIATVSVATGTSNAGPDFGFNFDVVTNTNNAGQGSLAQFIANSNSLGDENLLAQAGSNNAGTLPAGVETSIFMIPAAGLNANGVAAINLTTALPTVIGTNTSIDGTTQTINIGNTNNVLLGLGGTVGTNSTALSQLNGPEVQLKGTQAINGITVNADATTVRGLSIYGFITGILGGPDYTGLRVEQNVIGASATTFADPTGTNRNRNEGINLNGSDNGTVTNNLIGFNGGMGIWVLNNANNNAITGNEIRSNALTTNVGNGERLVFDGLELQGTSTGNTVSGNLITANVGHGIDSYNGGAGPGGNTITNNTISNNGVGVLTNTGEEGSGLRIFGATAPTLIANNILSGNNGSGVLVLGFANQVTISQNSTSGNTRLGIDLLTTAETNLNSTAAGTTFWNGSTGTTPNETLNDNGDTATGGNGLLNFPVLTTASISSTSLVVSGFARPGSLVELFLATPLTTDPTNVGANTTISNRNFGQGSSFLAGRTEGNTTDDSNTGTGSYSGLVNGINQGTDNTNQFTFTILLSDLTPAQRTALQSGSAILTSTATLTRRTSEFSGNLALPVADVTAAITGPTTLNAGQATGTYTATFTNEGPNTAANVTRTVALPAGATLSTAQQNDLITRYGLTAGSFTTTGSGITAVTTINFGSVASVAVNTNSVFTFAFTAPTTLSTTLTLAANTSTTSSEGANTAPDQATLILNTVATADVAATITASASTTTGTFTATFVNNGPQTAANVTPTVQLPANLVGVAVTNGWTYTPASGLVTLNAAPIAANSGISTTLVITYSLASAPSVPVTATARISTTTNEGGATANNVASATMAPQFDLTTTLTGPTTAAVIGSPTMLYVTTTNNGPNTAGTATQTVTIPSAATLAGSIYITNGGTYTYAGGIGTVTFPVLTNIPSGQTVTNSISFLAPSANFAPTAAVTTTSTTETNTANNTANLNGGANGTSVAVANTPTLPNTTTPILANESTTIAATVGNTTTPATVVTPGTVVTYTVTSTNKGFTGTTPSATVTERVQLLPGLTTTTLRLGGVTGTQVNGTGTISFTTPAVAGNTASTTTAGTSTYDPTTGVLTYYTVTNQASGFSELYPTIAVTAPTTVGNGGQLVATASVSTNLQDNVPADNVASVGVRVRTAPDVATTITGPSTTTAGLPATYVVKFTNGGATDAIQVTQIARLPAGLSNVVVTDANGTTVSGAYNSTTGQITFPSITNDVTGTTQFYNITLTAPAQTFPVSSTITTVTSDGVSNNNSANLTTTVTPNADLAVSITGPATAVVGNLVTYAVTATNNGPTTASNVAATVQLPTGLTDVTAGPNGASYNSTTGLLTFATTTTLTAGNSAVNYVSFTMPSATATTGPVATGGQLNLTAGFTAASLTNDQVASNNTAGLTTSVAPATTAVADLETTLALTTPANSPASVTAGTSVTYTATYRNNGSGNGTGSAATNVVPTVNLPAGLSASTLLVGNNTGTLSGNVITFTSGPAANATYNTVTGLLTFPTVASLAASTTATSYTISFPAPVGNGQLVVASAISSQTSDNGPLANVATTSTNITSVYDVTTSLAGPLTAQAGVTNIYTVTTLNNGPSTATAATTQNVTGLPSGLTTATLLVDGLTGTGTGTITFTNSAGTTVATYSGTTLTFPSIANLPAGAANAAVHTFSLPMPVPTSANPTPSIDLTANVSSANETNVLANTDTRSTVEANIAPVAQNVWNALQSARSNDANTAAPTGLPISPLSAMDIDVNGSIGSYTIVAIPTSAQGVLYYNGSAITAGNASTTLITDATKLTFAPTAGYVGNATFTYLATDNGNGITANTLSSPVAIYTIAVAADQEAPAYVKTPLKGGTVSYNVGDIIAYTVDPNAANYGTTGTVYSTDGRTLNTNASNGIGSATPVVASFTSSRADVTSFASLGLTVDNNGRIVVSDPGTVASPKLRTGSYSIDITTIDANGGVTTQTVTFVIPAAPLPVVLTALTAQAVQNRDALLTWTTASEVNSAYFDVERSLDGTSYTKIGQVAAKGNSTTSSNYTFTDANVAARANGAVFYRLHQVDRDATASYSPVRTVSFTKVATVALSLYPNPAQNATTLDVSALPATGTYQVLVLDVTGRAVRTVSVAGGQLQPLNLTDLASGTYQVLVTGTLANGDALRQVIRLTKE